MDIIDKNMIDSNEVEKTIKFVVDRIKQLRANSGLSARELSQRIGMNEAYISRLESPKTTFEPSLYVVLAIIKACKSSETQFFYYDMNQYSTDIEIIELLRKTDDTKKRAIRDLLKS